MEYYQLPLPFSNFRIRSTESDTNTAGCPRCHGLVTTLVCERCGHFPMKEFPYVGNE
jgi:hypothetical protein